MDEPLKKTLIDAGAMLDSQGVAYALIGGLAASLRGQPRATTDVDLVIAADLDRAVSLIPNLAESEFAPLFDDVAEVVRRCLILPLRHCVTGVKVDLAIGLSGFERQLVSRSRKLSVAGVPIPVATAEDLIIMKILAGRPQDDQDIRGLLVAQGSQLDWNYCEKTAESLGQALAQDLLTPIRELRRRELP